MIFKQNLSSRFWNNMEMRLWWFKLSFYLNFGSSAGHCPTFVNQSSVVGRGGKISFGGQNLKTTWDILLVLLILWRNLKRKEIFILFSIIHWFCLHSTYVCSFRPTGLWVKSSKDRAFSEYQNPFNIEDITKVNLSYDTPNLKLDT